MKKDYSDIEVLYGKPSVSTVEVYESMMDTAGEWGSIGNGIWEKENDSTPITDAERDALEDVEARLWQMCHQLIHNVVIDNGLNSDEDTSTLELGEGLKAHTSRTEGTVWIETPEGDIDDDEIELIDLLSIAQAVYNQNK